ncbi:MAG: TIGR00341 family protein, partial [Chitinophagales bacterium]
MNKVLAVIRQFIKNQFSLAQDTEREFEIIDAIKKGVPFRGINLYTLIFAVLICSVGLNVNSTAVIIGAMLISPLMGPIMGLGLGVGINDFDLMKKAGKNLALAVIFSVLTSCLYFLISPITEVQSELLARTSPTTFDVLIAIFGGLTGVLAGSSKEKGNAIPGVAIATALMPPLCTAGFGIATANWSFVLGAMYLFFINSVMISVTTLTVVKILNFRPKEFLDKKKETFTKRAIYL